MQYDPYPLWITPNIRPESLDECVTRPRDVTRSAEPNARRQRQFLSLCAATTHGPTAHTHTHTHTHTPIHEHERRRTTVQPVAVYLPKGISSHPLLESEGNRTGLACPGDTVDTVGCGAAGGLRWRRGIRTLRLVHWLSSMPSIVDDKRFPHLELMTCTKTKQP